MGITLLDSLAMPKFRQHEMGYRMRIEREGYETVDVLAALFTNLRGGGSAPVDTMYLDLRVGRTRDGSDSRPDHRCKQALESASRTIHRPAGSHEPGTWSSSPLAGTAIASTDRANGAGTVSP